MTVFVKRIFLDLHQQLGWYHRSYRIKELNEVIPEIWKIKKDKLLIVSSRFGDLQQLPDHYRGSHIVRDPRDLLVSGYKYHKWCGEEWATVPLSTVMHNYLKLHQLDIKKDISGFSYKDLLNYLDQDTGLLVELNWRKTSFGRMLDWDYDNPSILEMNYEKVFGNEKESFYKLFKHYGLDSTAIDLGLQLVNKYSFENQMKLGHTGEKRHLSKGSNGQWKEYFSPALKNIFKERYQGLILKLGYEKDDNW
jgi:hypothetical protein